MYKLRLDLTFPGLGGGKSDLPPVPKIPKVPDPPNEPDRSVLRRHQRGASVGAKGYAGAIHAGAAGGAIKMNRRLDRISRK